MRRMWEHFCFQQYLVSLFEEGGNCPPDTWAAGVAPSLDSLALQLKAPKKKNTSLSFKERFRHFVHFERVRMSIALHVESQNWPSRFAQRGRLIQQVDIWRKDQWSTCKSFVFNIFGSRDLLAPYLFLFLGRCRLIRSLHSVRNWRVGHVIDRNRCGLCHPVVRQFLVVFCPLVLRARPGPEHLEWSFWHCVAFSRVSTLQVISSSLC